MHYKLLPFQHPTNPDAGRFTKILAVNRTVPHPGTVSHQGMIPITAAAKGQYPGIQTPRIRGEARRWRRSRTRTASVHPGGARTSRSPRGARVRRRRSGRTRRTSWRPGVARTPKPSRGQGKGGHPSVPGEQGHPGIPGQRGTDVVDLSCAVDPSGPCSLTVDVDLGGTVDPSPKTDPPCTVAVGYSVDPPGPTGLIYLQA